MKNLKKIILTTLLAFVLFIKKAIAYSTSTINNTNWGYNDFAEYTTTGLGTRSLKDTSMGVTNMVWVFVTAVFSTVFLAGGIKWIINKHKDKNKTEKAKRVVKIGIIGIIISLVLYAIAFYIIRKTNFIN